MEYSGVKCTGTATVLNPTLNSCSPPMAKYCKAYYMFTSVSDVASSLTSPVSSPVVYTIRSPVSYPVSTPSYNSYTYPTSSPVTYPSSSSVLSTTNSPAASPSSSTTLLTGFYQEIYYSDTACTAPSDASSVYLNTCIHVGYGIYKKYTATSTYYRQIEYNDAECTVGATTVKGFTYTSGACVSTTDRFVKQFVKQDSSVAINIARVTVR